MRRGTAGIKRMRAFFELLLFAQHLEKDSGVFYYPIFMLYGFMFFGRH
jgi:hypothetical protein